MTAREVLLAWAKSPGFAAIHNGQATDEQIVDDLMVYLSSHEAFVTTRPAIRAMLAATFDQCKRLFEEHPT